MFEIDLLKAFRDEFGLLDCEFSGRKLDTSSVVGAGSYPSDVKDSVHTECVVSVDSIETSTSKCTPMKGYMTVWVSEMDKRRLSENDIYTVIDNYSTSYATDDVLVISYIGTRPELELSEQAMEDTGDVTSTEPLGSGAIAGIVLASLFAIIAALALVTQAKKRRDNQKKTEAEKRVVDDAFFMNDDDVEVQVSQVKQVRDDASIVTEDHTFDDTTSNVA